MDPMICRVVSQSEESSVNTKDGKQLAKCFVRLKAVGGDFADEFVCSVLGNQAQVKYLNGELVAVQLRFSVYEVNGGIHQDVKANDIVKIKL